MQDQDNADSVWHVRRLADRSFNDEFGGTIENDLALLQIAIVCIVVYTYLAISNQRDGIVGSRMMLTFGGVLPTPASLAVPQSPFATTLHTPTAHMSSNTAARSVCRHAIYDLNISAAACVRCTRVEVLGP